MLATCAASAFVLVACTGGSSSEPDAAGTPTRPAPGSARPATPPIPPPTPDPAPADPDDDVSQYRPGPELEQAYGALGWPFGDDFDRIQALPAQLDAAFDRGAKEGFRFLAEHSWPDTLTGDAMLACRAGEPTPSYSELDAENFRIRFAFKGLIPTPGFVYPPTGQVVSELGLRPYMTPFTATFVYGDEEAAHEPDSIARVAVRADGRVVMFPQCFDYLPGEALAHRGAADGDVGGYTAAEAEGDATLMFEFFTPELRTQLCDLFRRNGAAAIVELLTPPDVFGVTVPADVADRVATRGCRSQLN
jgi:hypothetical protein